VTARGFLDHVDLSVADVGRSAPLYDCLLSALGFVRDQSPPDRARWRRPGSVFTLEIRPAEVVGSYRRGATGLEHIAFRAENPADVDAVFDVLRRAGFEVREPPQHYAGEGYVTGYYALGFEDPDGIHLEVVHWAEGPA
jgi:catechol 2,3-dioxygenase-like lactoylglutathione lyase family enzyme